jgi:hypothetical protein
VSRKRSRKDRYFRFLRRIWPAPSLAALSLVACASPPPTSAGALARVAPAAAVANQAPSPSPRDELRYESKPKLPGELHLPPEFRSPCAPVVGLPPSLVLHEKDEVVDALEPIASCLTLGPAAH